MSRHVALLAAAVIASISVVIAAQNTPASPDADAAAQQQREAAFIKTLSGATLVGSFTVTGQGEDQKLRRERYTIEEVRKLQDNLFLFRARIQYGDKDVTIPMPLVVVWAGDTPVITLTNAPITPGGNRYTARVLIYKDHYAGFWSAPGHGGHLFGTIERGGKGDAN